MDEQKKKATLGHPSESGSSWKMVVVGYDHFYSSITQLKIAVGRAGSGRLN